MHGMHAATWHMHENGVILYYRLRDPPRAPPYPLPYRLHPYYARISIELPPATPLAGTGA